MSGHLHCLFLRAALVFLLSAAVLQGDLQGAAQRVAGVVVNAATAQPVKHTRLTLISTEGAAGERATLADEAGQFAFEGVLPGKYWLVAEHRGFARQEFGETDLNSGRGTVVETGPGLATGNLVFRLIPPVAIAGRLVDDLGEAASGVQVQAFRVYMEEGKPHLAHVGQTQSDDLGEYRIADLTAGSYYVAASGYPWYSDPATALKLPAELTTSHEMARRTYLTAYFPDGADASSAAPLRVAAGEEARADMMLRTVSGADVIVKTGGDGKYARISLEAPGIGNTYLMLASQELESGAAAFPGIPPGHYRLLADGGSDRSHDAVEDIEVGATNLQVEFHGHALHSVRGKVDLNGRDEVGISGESLRLRNEEDGSVVTIALLAQGAFASDELAPGRYRLSLNGKRGICVDSIEADNAQVLGDAVVIEWGVETRLIVHANTTPAGTHCPTN